MKIEIERATSAHVHEIFEMENKVSSLPWSKQSFKDDIVNNEIAIYLVALFEKKVIGYVGMWKISNEGHILNIAVSEEHRRKNIGTVLIKSIERIAIDEGIDCMTLEVRVSNIAAISLYKKNGYNEFGNRKSYYSDNNEDALIMWKEKLFY